jgi:endonuclease/exonuclease/phosphatase family metal-dependent hydrolase
MTLNMDGLRYPPWLGWNPDRSLCAARYRAVGERIRDASPAYDIVAVEELYRSPDLHIVTCDPTPFLEALPAPGGPPGALKSVLFTPVGRRWMLEADGGIGILTPHPIVAQETLRFAGAGGPFLAARGVLFARIALPERGAAVDAYVVHLSPGLSGAAERRRELGEVAKFIEARSARSGNPVIVLGDFNIEGPPRTGPEYRAMKDALLRPRDLWLEEEHLDPGYTYDCVENAVAALRGCHDRARIDYLLIPPVSGGGSHLGRSSSVHRVEWQTDGPGPLPVSDHYGVEAFVALERGE